MGNDYSTKIRVDEEVSLETDTLPFRLVVDLLEYVRVDLKMRNNRIEMKTFFGYFKNDNMRKVFLIFRSVGYIPSRDHKHLEYAPKGIVNFSSHFSTELPFQFISNCKDLVRLRGIKLDHSTDPNYLDNFPEESKIEVLSLILKTSVSTNMIEKINHKFQRLRKLSMSCHKMNIDVLTTKDFSIGSLQFLKLDRIINNKLLQIGSLQNLKKIVISRCENVLQQHIEFIVRTESIQKVTISSSIVHFDIFHIFSKPNLKYVNLNHLRILKKNTTLFRYIILPDMKSEEILPFFRCHELRTLKLTKWKSIHPSIIDYICENCKELRSLEMESCGLKDKHLDMVIRKAKFWSEKRDNGIKMTLFFEGNKFSHEKIEEFQRLRPELVLIHNYNHQDFLNKN